MDVGVDAGVEQVSLTGDLFLPSTAEGPFSAGKGSALDPFFYYRGLVTADFGYNVDVFKSGEGIVYEKMLG